MLRKAAVKAVVEALEPRCLLSVTSASISQPQNPVAGSPVSFAVTASSDQCSNITYQLGFGDGASDTLSGMSGMFCTDSHTYNAPGVYTVTANANDGDPNDPSGLDATPITVNVAPAPMQLSAPDLSLIYQQGYSGPIATVVNADPSPASYSATLTVDGGLYGNVNIAPDGHGNEVVTAPGLDTLNSGQHPAYLDVTESINGQSAEAGTSFMIDIAAPAPMQLTAQNVSIDAGEVYSGTIGVISNVDPSPAVYSASLWVNGATYPITPAADGMGNDNIIAHLPPLPVGQYIAHLDVSESYNGQLVNSASSDFTFNADPPTLLAQGTVFSATAGQSWSNAVATFTATTLSTPTQASDFSASTNFGDGSSSPSSGDDADSIADADDGSGGYVVNATYTYASAGTFALSTTITHTPSGATVTADSTAYVTVDLPSFTVNAWDVSYEAPGQAAVPFATISDDSGSGAASHQGDFSATLNINGQVFPVTLKTDGQNIDIMTPDLSSLPFTTNTDVTGTLYVTNGVGIGCGNPMSVSVTVPVHPQPPDAPLTDVQGSTNNAVQDVPWPGGTLATFVDPNPDAQASNYSLAFSGGDVAFMCMVVPDPGVSNGWMITTGSQTFSQAGSFGGTLTITDNAPAAQGNSVSVGIGVNVAPSPLSDLQVHSISVTVGQQFGPAEVATFTDADTSAVASDFSAQIAWGDGGPTTDGSVTANASGGFSVDGSYSYSSTPSGNITVTITDSSGDTLSGSSYNPSTVPPPPPLPTLGPISIAPNSPIEMFPYSGGDANIGAVKDADSDASDSPAIAGTLSIPGFGDFPVNCDPTNGAAINANIPGLPPGVYAATLNVTETAAGFQNNPSASASVEIDVVYPGFGYKVIATPSPLIEHTPFDGHEFGYIDAFTFEACFTYTATVTIGGQTYSTNIDGNGVITATNTEGLVSSLNAGDAAAEIDLTVTDNRFGIQVGSALTTYTQIVNDAPLSAQGATAIVDDVSILADYNRQWTGPVAYFQDADPQSQPIGFYEINVNWGDGNTDSNAQTTWVGPGTNDFKVSDSHTYTAAANYTVTVTIADPDGSTATAIDNATVGPFLIVTSNADANEDGPDGNVTYSLISAVTGGPYDTTQDIPVSYSLSGPAVDQNAISVDPTAIIIGPDNTSTSGDSSADQNVHALLQQTGDPAEALTGSVADPGGPWPVPQDLGLTDVGEATAQYQCSDTAPQTLAASWSLSSTVSMNVKTVIVSALTCGVTATGGNAVSLYVLESPQGTITLDASATVTPSNADLVYELDGPGQIVGTPGASNDSCTFTITPPAGTMNQNAGPQYVLTVGAANGSGGMVGGPQQEIDVYVYQSAKVEIDSDNNDGTNLPDNTPGEIALHMTAPGKIIAQNAANLTPFVVNLPADPTGMSSWHLMLSGDTTDVTIYSDAQGQNPVTFNNVVGPSADLTCDPSMATYYISGIAASASSGDITIAAETDVTVPSGAQNAGSVLSCQDPALVTVLGPVAIEIDSDNNDGTGMPDNTAAEIALHMTAPGKIVAEGATNLTPFIVDLPADPTQSLQWRLRLHGDTSDVAIYSDAAGSSQVTMAPDPANQSDLVSAGEGLSLGGATQQTYYIKGMAPSASSGDITISDELILPGSSTSSGSGATGSTCGGASQTGSPGPSVMSKASALVTVAQLGVDVTEVGHASNTVHATNGNIANIYVCVNSAGGWVNCAVVVVHAESNLPGAQYKYAGAGPARQWWADNNFNPPTYVMRPTGNSYNYTVLVGLLGPNSCLLATQAVQVHVFKLVLTDSTGTPTPLTQPVTTLVGRKETLGYTIIGVAPPVAVASQEWTIPGDTGDPTTATAIADYDPMANNPEPTVLGDNVQLPEVGFYWVAQMTSVPVSVAVTFGNSGLTYTVSQLFTVQAPVVGGFSADAAGVFSVLRSTASGPELAYLSIANACGIKFSPAWITTPACNTEGGVFGLFQLATTFDVFNYSDGSCWTADTYGAYCNDGDANSGSPCYWHVETPIAPGGTNANLSPGQPLTDAPGVYTAYGPNDGAWMTDGYIWHEFKDYLMFKPTNGVWVALSWLQWQCGATFEAAPDGSISSYTPLPGTTGPMTIPGTPTTQLPTWSGTPGGSPIPLPPS